jgi:acyl CoA:acetate/3-ketoacid CoA transferase
VYLWQTGVTEQGLKKLKAIRPELSTEAGMNTLIKPDSTKKK